MLYSRRDVGKLAIAGIPLAGALAAAPKINSKINGVQIGAITYSFNRIASNPQDIIKAMVEIGIGDAELMSNHCEALAGAPAVARPGGAGGRRGTPPTPEQQAEMQRQQEALRNWRAAANANTWKAVTKQFNDAGISVGLLCYNMQDRMTDDDIEYGFQMAKGLGAKGITTSTTVSMSKRIAPYADKHKLLVGYHGHDQTNDPNQFATTESYAVGMSYGGYNGINLDVGHFTASNYDAVAYIKEHHAKITNLHIKDRKKDHGPNTPFGEGDTPLKAIFQLLKKEKYPFPANLELEYRIPENSDVVTEMKRCLAYVKDCLA